MEFEIPEQLELNMKKSRLGLLTSESGRSVMTTFPWILIPTVGVPLALALHGTTLYRLRNIESSPLQ